MLDAPRWYQCWEPSTRYGGGLYGAARHLDLVVAVAQIELRRGELLGREPVEEGHKLRDTLEGIFEDGVYTFDCQAVYK